jgi:group I intron endonuclease
MGGIYQILNTANNKRYIGSTQNFSVRLYDHRKMLRKGNHHSAKLQRAYSKYGETSFVFEPIIECAVSMLTWYEQQVMDKLGADYNIHPAAGCPRGHKYSEESRQRMSAKLIGNTRALGLKRPPEFAKRVSERHTGKIVSDESRAKMSAAHSNRSDEYRAALSEGRKKYLAVAGFVLSDDARARMSAAGKNKIVSAETRAKLSAASKNRVVSDDTKAKLRAANIGTTRSAETCKKMSESRIGKKRGPYKCSVPT